MAAKMGTALRLKAEARLIAGEWGVVGIAILRLLSKRWDLVPGFLGVVCDVFELKMVLCECDWTLSVSVLCCDAQVKLMR